MSDQPSPQDRWQPSRSPIVSLESIEALLNTPIPDLGNSSRGTFDNGFGRYPLQSSSFSDRQSSTEHARDTIDRELARVNSALEALSAQKLRRATDASRNASPAVRPTSADHSEQYHAQPFMNSYAPTNLSQDSRLQSPLISSPSVVSNTPQGPQTTGQRHLNSPRPGPLGGSFPLASFTNWQLPDPTSQHAYRPENSPVPRRLPLVGPTTAPQAAFDDSLRGVWAAPNLAFSQQQLPRTPSYEASPQAHNFHS